MNTYNLAYILVAFGYFLIFGILGAITLLLHTPKEKGMESYKKARKTLGASLSVLSIFCIIILIYPQDHSKFEDFWLLVTITLIHSWLTYSSLLFLLESPRYITRRFLIDGALPALLMISCGIIGIFFPATQDAMQIAFGCIFALKCLYMFYVCITEFKKCKNELDNYYDTNPDITWIRGLIYLSLVMSALTVVAFYVPSIHLIYLASIPVIYAYIVFKIINFAPRKIDAIRQQNNTLDAPVAEKKTPKGIDEKIGPLVDEWVAEKRFCTAELTIKDVALEMGTNQNYLSQYLNGSLNTSFQTWLNTLRVEESKMLLTDGNKRSIEEVGAMVGFSQIYNYSRWFKAVTGTTPFRFRQGR